MLPKLEQIPPMPKSSKNMSKREKIWVDCWIGVVSSRPTKAKFADEYADECLASFDRRFGDK